MSPDAVTRLRIPELDDIRPGLVSFDLVDESKVRQITAGFRAGSPACLVVCDGETYRPYLVVNTRPGWWNVQAVRLNLPQPH